MANAVDNYDRPERPEPASPADERNPAGQDVRGPADRGHAHSYHYDDSLHIALASARLDGYRSDPQAIGSGVRGLANAGDELARGGVYSLRDPVTGQVVSTGQTKSPLRGQGEHFPDPRLSDYEFEVVARTDVYAQQRSLEQRLHNAYNRAFNRINPISATNPNRGWYLSKAEQFLARYGGGG